VVTPKIVFEKTDSTDEDAFRLSKLEDVHKKYKLVADEEESEFEIHIRRFNEHGKKPLDLPILEKDSEHTKIEKLLNIKDLGPIHWGVEIGLGGGYVTEVTFILPLKIDIDQETGRGKVIQDSDTSKRLLNIEEAL